MGYKRPISQYAQMAAATAAGAPCRYQVSVRTLTGTGAQKDGAEMKRPPWSPAPAWGVTAMYQAGTAAGSELWFQLRVHFGNLTHLSFQAATESIFGQS